MTETNWFPGTEGTHFAGKPLPREITKHQWDAARRHGYASITDGQKFVLLLDHATQATVLVPVTVRAA